VDQEERQRAYQANLEFWKATCEYFKTFSTICLASIAAFAALLAGFFAADPPKNVEESMFSLIRCLSPKILSWSANHRSMSLAILFIAFTLVVFFWFHWFEKLPWKLPMAILLFVAFTLAWFHWLVGMHIPCLSQETLFWFENNRPIFTVIAFFAFGMAGFFSLGGMHDCRNALWDSRNVTAERRFKRMRRYKRIAWWRACVVFSYTIATICFFIILALRGRANRRATFRT
jgi:hypothetical protein